MNFYPLHSIAIPRNSNKLIASDAKSLAAFWKETDSTLGEAISSAAGCYIFSIRAGKGELPWYVGLAEKQSFRKECFTPHKINHYNNAIAARKGTPYITFIPKYTPGGKLAKPNVSGHKDIQQLEQMLIGNSLSRNMSLFNLRDTKILREMVVPGLLNSPQGKPAPEVRAFKKLLGL